MVRKFRARPVTIEAVQWTGELSAFKEWMDRYNCLPIILTELPTLLILTLEGKMAASIGDYVIRGTHGEFYPCKPDVFETKYQEVCSCKASDNVDLHGNCMECGLNWRQL